MAARQVRVSVIIEGDETDNREITIATAKLENGVITDLGPTTHGLLSEGRLVEVIEGEKSIIVEITPKSAKVEGRWRFISADEDETLDALSAGRCTVHMHGDGRG